jgi:hypothetical protein
MHGLSTKLVQAHTTKENLPTSTTSLFTSSTSGHSRTLCALALHLSCAPTTRSTTAMRQCFHSTLSKPHLTLGSCANSYTLNKLLKSELGFQGYVHDSGNFWEERPPRAHPLLSLAILTCLNRFVMSDWAAQHSGVSSALAGLDMTMVRIVFLLKTKEPD